MATVRRPDDLTTLLVYGFIRDLQGIFHLHIPDQIAALCAVFRGAGNEYFLQHGDSYKVDRTGRILIKEEWKCQSAFGNVLIHSLRETSYCWTFRLSHVEKFIYFGITQSTEHNVDDNFAFNEKTYNYAVRDRGKKTSRGIVLGYDYFKVRSGGVIKMELDLKRKELKFYLDDRGCLYPAYSKWDIQCGADIYYKMAIYSYCGGLTIKLIDYTESE